jgi:tetraacyldisaccharide 4'-kinase
MAALGNPIRFQNDVEALNLNIKGSRFFRDHFRLEKKHWHRCIEEARSCGAEAILTTEKDAVKLSGFTGFPLLVSVQSTSITEAEEFERLLARRI